MLNKLKFKDFYLFPFITKKVIICSPSWFYAYLQTVLQWMNSMKIQEQAKDIQMHNQPNKSGNMVISRGYQAMGIGANNG